MLRTLGRVGSSVPRSYSTHAAASAAKFTIPDMRKKRLAGEPIVMITAHDYPSAMISQRAGVDIVLVGDSLAMTALGYESTQEITMDEMLHHCRAVKRGAHNGPLLIGDMPFGSYQISQESAMRNAFRILQEGKMEAVKLEGGQEMAETVAAIVRAGVPVMGHVGLLPQTSTTVGGFRVQGRTATAAKRILDDALALQEAGCFAIVIEAVPAAVGTRITELLDIPTIGIGAGPSCSGQVLVYNDLLGVYDRFLPKFCKQYANLQADMHKAVLAYASDVRARQFPSKDHCYTIKEDERERFIESTLTPVETSPSTHFLQPEPTPSLFHLPTLSSTSSNLYQTEHQQMLEQQMSLLGASPVNSNHGNRTLRSNSKRSLPFGFGSRSYSTNATAALFHPSTSEQQQQQQQSHISTSTSSSTSSSTSTNASKLKSESPPLCVAILGAGAVGSFLGGQLSLHPHLRVTLFDPWRDHLDAICSHGLQMTTNARGADPAVVASQFVSCQPVLFSNRVEFDEDHVDVFDVIFITTKGWDTAGAAQLAKVLTRRSHNAVLVSLQNGFGHWSTCQHILGPDSHTLTTAAVTGIGARILRPGAIEHTGVNSGAFQFSPTHGHEHMTRLLTSMTDVGLLVKPTSTTTEFLSVQWQKLIVNACINPLTAICQITNGKLLDPAPFYHPLLGAVTLKDVMYGLCYEAHHVGAALGLPLRSLEDTFQEVLSTCQKTSSNHSSMLIDVLRKQPTEIDYINGAVIQLGRENAIDTQENQRICEVLSKVR